MALELHIQQENFTVDNTMELQIFKTLWGYNGNTESAVKEALAANFDGIEGPAPEKRADAQRTKSTI